MERLQQILSPMGQKCADPTAPEPFKLMAAMGRVPLPPEDMTLVLFVLSQDASPKVSEAARQGFKALKKANFEAVFRKNKSTPEFLDFVAKEFTERSNVMEMLLVQKDLRDDTLIWLGSRLEGKALEILAGNQRRLLANNNIVQSILANPALKRTTRSRLVEFSLRESIETGLSKEDIQEAVGNVDWALPKEMIDESFLDKSGNLIREVNVKEYLEEEGLDLVALEQEQAVRGPASNIQSNFSMPQISQSARGPSASQMGLSQPSMASMEQAQTTVEKVEEKPTVVPAVEEPKLSRLEQIRADLKAKKEKKKKAEKDGDEDGPSNDSKPMDQLIKDMSIPQKVKAALMGNKTVRQLLLRDRNKVVSNAVLRNPAIREGEIEKIVSNPQVSEETIRKVSKNKKWMKNYGIKCALAMNPKTPPGFAVRLLNFLRDKELRTLMRSKGVSNSVVSAARRLMAQRNQ